MSGEWTRVVDEVGSTRRSFVRTLDRLLRRGGGESQHSGTALVGFGTCVLVVPIVPVVSRFFRPMFWSLFSSSPNNEVRYGADTPLLTLTHNAGGGSKLSINRFLQTYCPAVFPAFRPSRWLPKYTLPHLFPFPSLMMNEPSGHLQTVYLGLADVQDKVEYERYYLLSSLTTIFLLISPQKAHSTP